MDCATKRSLLEEEIEKLQAEKAAIDSRIALLRSQLAALAVADGKTDEEEALEYDKCCQQCPPRPPTPTPYGEHGLSKEMIYRYSRHLLLPSFGVEGQFKLSNSSILVVGAGGLGSPISMYLAACGVGCLGIVDNDVVELNNLQRQIIHTEAYIGRSKVESAAAVCRAINSSIKVVEYKEALMASNALDIVKKYDIVVDATDNIPSRYMINDCCVILNKPLVSGAALGLEGQLTVYHHDGGPCYRCLFPIPPPTAACQRCSDSGVLGVVPGIIGCLQALEAIKLACSVGEPLSGRMFLFDASSARAKIVKIRGRSLRCDICGENPTLTQQLFRSFDYEKFTETPVLDPAPKNVLLLPEAARLSSKEFKESLDNGEPHVLIDVRPEHHFRIASLPNSVNIPLSTLESDLSAVDSILKEAEQRMGQWTSLYVVCRRGNDSQRAVQLLNQSGYHLAKDIVGGLEAWAKEVNPDFPIY